MDDLLRLELAFERVPAVPHARPHQHRAPLGPDLAPVPVGARNVTLRVIADHVDTTQGTGGLVMALGPQQLVPVGRQHALGVPVRLRVRLADNAALQLVAARQTPPHSRHGGLKGALTEPGEVVARRPEQVGIAEVERRLAVLLPAAVRQGVIVVFGGVGAQVAPLREEQVCDELDVERPVARVVEDEHGVDLERFFQLHAAVGPVDGLGKRLGRGGVSLLEEVLEWVDVGLADEDVGWCHDIAEAVSREALCLALRNNRNRFCE